MDFILNEVVFRYGDNETIVPEDVSTYPTAEFYDYEESEIWYDPTIYMEHTPVIENGKAVIKRERVFKNPAAGWYKYGRDHRQIESQEDGTPRFERIVPRRLACIRIDDLQQLVEFGYECQKRGYLYIEFEPQEVAGRKFAGYLMVHK